MILSTQLKEHLKGPKASYLGTRDKDYTTDIIRALGITVTGPDSLKFFIAEPTAHKALDNLRANKIVTLSVTNILNLESFQLKGRLINVIPVNDEEIKFIKEFVLQFEEAAVRMGLPIGLVTNYMLHLPALAVEFVAEQIFEQTPKIGTGKLISAV